MPDTSVSDVWRLLDEIVAPLGAAPVSLAEAQGRVLRRHAETDADQPPFDRSAMDGYLVTASKTPGQFRLVGAVKAGDSAPPPPAPDEALRIFTGAAIPPGDFAVLMQEEARLEGQTLHVAHPLAPGEYIRRRGSDARAGDELVRAGTRLGPVELSVLGAIGETHPLVTRPPHVAHASTGDEIVPVDTTPGSGQMRDSNRVLLAALLADSGVPASHLHQEHWADDPAHAAQRIVTGPFAEADIVLISGGASVGEHDYAARVLTGAGYELRVKKVDQRPGRPLLVGVRGRQLAFGLPGNPVSHFVCYHLFVRYALARLAGATPPGWVRARLAGPLPRAANRRPTYWPAAFIRDPDGLPALHPLPWNNSGHLAALVGAQALFLVPPNTVELPAGAVVDTLPLCNGRAP